jgi:hypothetical protein
MTHEVLGNHLVDHVDIAAFIGGQDQPSTHIELPPPQFDVLNPRKEG